MLPEPFAETPPLSVRQRFKDIHDFVWFFGRYHLSLYRGLHRPKNVARLTARARDNGHATTVVGCPLRVDVVDKVADEGRAGLHRCL